MKVNRCLYCYQALSADETDFHKKCSRKMFGQDQPPILETGLNEIQKLAGEIVLRSVAVTGVQPKLSLTIEPVPGDPKRSRFTIVGLWGKYILKPPTKEFPALPENEDLTMHLAQSLRILTAQHSLIRLSSGELAYITKRFDRKDSGEKVAMEDMCQLSEKLTADKYHGSMEQVGKLILKYSTRSGFDALNFFEIALFSFMTGNADMHLKNFSLLSPAPGETILAPAYDLLSTALALPADKEEVALTLNARKNKLRRADFEQLAARLGINERSMSAIFAKYDFRLESMLELIDTSFIPEMMKHEYKHLIQSRIKRIIDKKPAP